MGHTIDKEPGIFAEARSFHKTRGRDIAACIFVIHCIDDVKDVCTECFGNDEVFIGECKVGITITVGEKFGEFCF